MNVIVPMSETSTLPALIDRAASALVNARSSAEVLEARDLAGIAYDAAKKTARFAKAKGAHDALIAAAHRTQADALEIEARAKRRLADEYDAAQERGEIAKAGNPNSSAMEELPGVTDLGLTHKDIHEARIIRDAEEAEPGIVRRALDEVLKSREEPTRAKLGRVLKPKSRRKRQALRDHNSSSDSQHDRDLRMLLGVWEAACESARDEFLKAIHN